jgi:hypothetical protein
MTPRLWSIVFHLHADAMATVHVHVDSRLLLPSCESRPVPDALRYVEAVLVDVHPNDQLALRVQSITGAPESRRCRDALDAKLWLRERVALLRRTLGLGPPGATFEEGDDSHGSGVRPALPDELAAAPPRRPFKRGS